MLFFSEFVKPKITGADTSRLQIKITSVPSGYATLYNSANNIINNGDTFNLDELITFKPLENKFGAFKLEYSVEVITIDYPHTTYSSSIIFNVCYKYCQECSAYDSSNPTNKQCTSCIPGETYFIEGVDIETDICFSIDEINAGYPNYYLDGPPEGTKYKKCNDPCQTCKLNPNNCHSCKTGYYFISGVSSEIGNCLNTGMTSSHYQFENSADMQLKKEYLCLLS